MMEPLDDELRAYIEAFKAVERPSPARSERTWAGVAARTRPPAPVVPLARRRIYGAVLVAVAAAVVLYVGAAATRALWRSAAVEMQAPFQRADAAAEQASRREVAPATALRASGDPIAPAPAVEGPSPASQRSAAPSAAGARSLAPRGRARVVDERSAAPVPSLRAEEIASFRQAQASLAEGRAEAALRELEQHGARYPEGFFEEERLVSRATALCQLGRVGPAAAARDQFLRDRPGSHLAARMRRICADPQIP